MGRILKIGIADKFSRSLSISMNINFLLLLTASVLFPFFSGSYASASIGEGVYEQLRAENTINGVLEYLDTEDPQDARLAIIRLVEVGGRDVLPILLDLWNGRVRGIGLRHEEIYRDPIVRLTLAKELMVISPSMDYEEYIKAQAYSKNWIVQSIAAESLVVVGDDDSVDILGDLSKSSNDFVAEAALEAINKISHQSTNFEKGQQVLRHGPQEESLGRKGGGGEPLDQQVHAYLEARQYENALALVVIQARKGDPHAQHFAAEICLAMLPPDYACAVSWLREAVAQDYAPAKTSLAVMYMNGLGVGKNRKHALELLEDAKQDGDPSAKKLLEKGESRGWWKDVETEQRQVE